MDLFYRLDDWLFDQFFEKTAHWWQKTFGQNCFWLAKVFCLISIVIFTLGFWLLKGEINFKIGMILLIFLFTIFKLDIIKEMEKLFWRWQEKNYSLINPRRLTKIGIINRLFHLFCSLILFIFFPAVYLLIEKSESCLLLIWWAPLLTISLYFACSTPLPPAKSRVREWLEAFKVKLVPAYKNV